MGKFQKVFSEDFFFFFPKDQQPGILFTEILPCPVYNVWGCDAAPVLSSSVPHVC